GRQTRQIRAPDLSPGPLSRRPRSAVAAPTLRPQMRRLLPLALLLVLALPAGGPAAQLPAPPHSGRAGRGPPAPAEGRPLGARERAALERADDHALGPHQPARRHPLEAVV